MNSREENKTQEISIISKSFRRQMSLNTITKSSINQLRLNSPQKLAMLQHATATSIEFLQSNQNDIKCQIPT